MLLRRNAREFGWSCRRSSPTHACDPETPASAYRGVLFRANQKHSDPPYPAGRLLRACRERKTGHTANKRDELAPSHWAPNGKRLGPCRSLALQDGTASEAPSLRPNVRDGSQADWGKASRYVRFTLDNRHHRPPAGRPLWAMCGRLRVGKKNLHVAALVGAAMCSAY